MRVLLVNSVNIKKRLETIFPHLGLSYIASNLRRDIPSINIRIVDRDLEKHIRLFKPDIVGVSSVSQDYDIARRHARLCKEYDLPVIMGGIHISALPATLSPDMDVGVMGEGEKTLSEVLLSLSNGGFDTDRLNKIDGILYRTGSGELISTPPRKLINPLDKLPLPARDLLPIRKWGVIHMFSSRGCPYDCSFCASTRFWSRIRFHSSNYVVHELKDAVSKYLPVSIVFYDDMFTASKKRLAEIVDGIRAEGLHNRVKLSISCRANALKEEIVELLKQMNVDGVGIGLESGSDETLRFLKGPSVSVKENIKALRLLERYNINVTGSFVIGTPDESLSEIRKTYNFIKMSSLNLVAVYVLTPYPGTPIWDLAREENLVSDNMKWDKLCIDFSDNLDGKIILSQKIHRKELIKIYFEFLRLAKKKRIASLVKNGMRAPKSLIPFLLKKINWYLDHFVSRLSNWTAGRG